MFRFLLSGVLSASFAAFALSAYAQPAAEPGKGDPVAEAFELPKGVAPTADQTKAVEQLRTRYESKLRDALERADTASTNADRAKANMEVRNIRTQIRQEMRKIFEGDDATDKSTKPDRKTSSSTKSSTTTKSASTPKKTPPPKKEPLAKKEPKTPKKKGIGDNPTGPGLGPGGF